MKDPLGTVKKFWLMAALVGVMSMALVACGDSNTPGTSSTAVPTIAGSTDGGTGAVPEYKVDLKEWAIELKGTEIKAGKSRLFVSNIGSFPHNLVIQGTDKKTPTFSSADGAQTLDVELAAGTYKWICDITGHAEKGMTGDLVVK